MEYISIQGVSRAILATILLAAAWQDCKTRRIPNSLAFAGWLIAPLYFLITLGIHDALSSVAGLGLLLVLTFPFFVVRWMGAGDVKLIAAVGAFVTLDGALPALLAIALTGGILGVVQLAWHRLLGVTAQRYWAMLGLTLAGRQGVYLDPSDAEAKRTMPYAISIAIGTFIYLVLA